MMGYYHWQMFPGLFGYGVGWVFTILFWIVVAYIIFAIFRKSKDSQYKEEKSGSKALGILKERYAKGEINKKEYQEKKKDIED